MHQKPSVPNIVAQTDADTTSEKDATIRDHPQVDDVQTGQGCAIPVPKQEKHEQQGCGDTNSVDTLTHTGHTPVEKAVEKNIGCGGNVEGLESPTIFQNKENQLKSKEGDLSQVDVKFREDNIAHIFRDEEGHLLDTLENRQRIINLVKDPNKYLGSDENKNQWHGEILSDGTQLWAQTRNGKIINCGLNYMPNEYNSVTGLNKFDPSKRRIK